MFAVACKLAIRGADGPTVRCRDRRDTLLQQRLAPIYRRNQGRSEEELSVSPRSARYDHRRAQESVSADHVAADVQTVEHGEAVEPVAAAIAADREPGRIIAQERFGQPRRQRPFEQQGVDAHLVECYSTAPATSP